MSCFFVQTERTRYRTPSRRYDFRFLRETENRGASSKAVRLIRRRRRLHRFPPMREAHQNKRSGRAPANRLRRFVGCRSRVEPRCPLHNITGHPVWMSCFFVQTAIWQGRRPIGPPAFFSRRINCPASGGSFRPPGRPPGPPGTHGDRWRGQHGAVLRSHTWTGRRTAHGRAGLYRRRCRSTR